MNVSHARIYVRNKDELIRLLTRNGYSPTLAAEVAQWVDDVGEYKDARVLVIPHAGISYLIYVCPAG